MSTDTLLAPTEAPERAQDVEDGEPIHLVSWGQWLLSKLLRRPPRALCGELMDTMEHLREAEPGDYRCPPCVEAHGKCRRCDG